MTLVANPLSHKPKDPEAKVPYGFDWSARVAELGTTISASAWTITLRDGSAGSVTLAQDSVSNTTTTTQIVLTGGTDGQDYDLMNQITMANGLIDQRTMVIQVRNR